MRTLLLALFVAGCPAPIEETDPDTDSDSDSDTDSDTVDPDGLDEDGFRAAFVATAMQTWPGVDFTYGGSTVEGGVDGAATVYATLWGMGYDVPAATADDLAENVGFPYVTAAEATHAQLSTGDFSALRLGDLLLLDYDFDGTWDHVAVFVGDDEALTASDYFDECVVADLTDDNDPFVQDLTWSQTGSARLDYAGIEPAFVP